MIYIGALTAAFCLGVALTWMCLLPELYRRHRDARHWEERCKTAEREIATWLRDEIDKRVEPLRKNAAAKAKAKK